MIFTDAGRLVWLRADAGCKLLFRQPLRKEQFELGNMLRSLVNPDGVRTLWASLKDERGHHEKHKITTIVFTPQFLRSPLEMHEGSFAGRSRTIIMEIQTRNFKFLAASRMVKHYAITLPQKIVF